MPEKKGSFYAKELFEKSLAHSTTREEWNRFDHSYTEALTLVAETKKKPELFDLDRFVHEELAPLINSRTPRYLQHAELARLMQWKLTRGKSRPLQKLVESNTSVSVVDASTASFQLLQEGKLEEAFDAIMRLRGVGVATASAIFAVLHPDLYPFMADEVIESVTNEGKEYTMTIYIHMKDALISKGRDLGWIAERVGRALWSCAIINAHQAAERKHQRQLARTHAAEAATESKTSEPFIPPPPPPPPLIFHSSSSEIGRETTTTRETTSEREESEDPHEGANKRRKTDY